MVHQEAMTIKERKGKERALLPNYKELNLMRFRGNNFVVFIVLKRVFGLTKLQL